MSGPVEMRCSVTSRETDEQLFGTAATATTWLMLEYDGRWERKAYEQSDLPDAVIAWLARQEAALPDARVQLIRQNPRLAPDGIAFFVALARETDPLLVEFSLDEYEDLLTLDLSAIGTDDDPYVAQRRDEPLFLVCTHGKRDLCCALRGLPVYVEATELAGASVWQTSHVGGHRFAANLLSFPYGIVYGRVEPLHVAEIVEATRRGEVMPEMMRGRACYNEHVQAAEHFLRSATGIHALDAFEVVEAAPEDPDHWQVRFKERASGELYTLDVAAEKSDFRVYKSCGDAEPKAVMQHRLLHFKVKTPAS